MCIIYVYATQYDNIIKLHGDLINLYIAKHMCTIIIIIKSLSCLQDGASPLLVASQEGHRDMVDILLKNGANINQVLEVPQHMNSDQSQLNCPLICSAHSCAQRN